MLDTSAWAQTLSMTLEKVAGPLTDTNKDGVVGGEGDEIGYTFIITNTGSGTLEYISVIDKKATVEGTEIRTLGPGEKDDTSYRARYIITRADVEDGKVVNTAKTLALQLRIYFHSDSIGLHDWEVMDDRCINRDDVGTLGIFAA